MIIWEISSLKCLQHDNTIYTTLDYSNDTLTVLPVIIQGWCARRTLMALMFWSLLAALSRPPAQQYDLLSDFSASKHALLNSSSWNSTNSAQ